MSYDLQAALGELADELYDAAADLPLADVVLRGANISEDLEDQLHRITRRFLRLAADVSLSSRLAKYHPQTYIDAHRRYTAVMSRAAGPVGQALAHLGDAVPHLGALHWWAGQPPGSNRADAERDARHVIVLHLQAASGAMRDASVRLRADALQFQPSGPAPQQSPVPAAEPSPAASSALRRL